MRKLLKATKDLKLLPNYPCFNLARAFTKKWYISEAAVNSDIKLACGYLSFPVMMLFNPAPNHESLPFEKMAKECITLRWLEDVLHQISLNLSDIIILDACTMPSKEGITELGKKIKKIRDQTMSSI